MEAFQKAKSENIYQGIHLETWMTVDQVLVVLECGPNGELIGESMNRLVYQQDLDFIK